MIGTGAAFQAQRLMEEGLPFLCLVDPDGAFYDRVGIGRVTWLHWLKPRVIASYARAWRRGGRQGRITGDPLRLSGVVVCDQTGTIHWSHLAREVGDNPPVASLLAALGP